MAGRVSEESNESFNALLAEIKRVLRSMPTTMGRQNKINERLQCNLKEDVSREMDKVLTERTGKKRGKYVARKRVDDNVKVVLSLVDGDDGIEYNGEMMFKLSDGSLLPEKYRDVYEWFAGRIPPKP